MRVCMYVKSIMYRSRLYAEKKTNTYKSQFYNKKKKKIKINKNHRQTFPNLFYTKHY